MDSTMIRVKNKKCIQNLSRKSLGASKTRNVIAIFAIALTTILFTTLFTIVMSINASVQQANFRQVGGYSHGTFKYLSEEQFHELKDDPLIEEWGLRRFLGMPTEVPFNKNHVEIGYSDAKNAHWSYCDPIEGGLPKEGTYEAATDLEVLKLLGVEPKLGATFSVTFYVDGVETTQDFTLSGWWEKDEITIANHILIPESRVDAILQELSVPSPANDGMTGSWNLDVMFKNSMQIERKMSQILANHGYRSQGANAEIQYINIGVNWGYTGAQLTENMDMMTVLAIVAILLLIIFTGYLIIYNVFQISVVGDIRFYGLLKTIGTTGKQMKEIIRKQAMILSAGGIPIGLVIGWIVGVKLTPVILGQLQGVVMDVVSANPLIFVFSALFSLFTVLLSCKKPGRMAARISPVEAVCYTENGNRCLMKKQKKEKRGRKGLTLFGMAVANMGRSRSKTVVTILSLSLAVVLLNATVMFANGFDMDKCLSLLVTGDYIVADARYFQVSSGLFDTGLVLPEETIQMIEDQGGITWGGRVYGRTWNTDVQQFVPEEYARTLASQWLEDSEMVENYLERNERNAEGMHAEGAQIYGMEPYILDKLKVIDGNLSKLSEPGGRYIAAVCLTDDYGNVMSDSCWANVGDIVTLRYVEDYETYDLATKEIIEDGVEIEDPATVQIRASKYEEVEYEVVALVAIPYSLSYRYHSWNAYVLNDQTFIQDTGTDCVMLYAFDTTEESSASMEAFLSDYTNNVNPSYDYESKATYAEEFASFRNMYLILGSVLSFIIGLIGILNFFNVILTGIITRRREFAMLQSIGMTGKQLKTMLVYEGLLYSLGSVICALTLSLTAGPVTSSVVSSMFWFFTYQPTYAPILLIAPIFALLGCCVPLVVYRMVAKQTIVERLRETEN